MELEIQIYNQLTGDNLKKHVIFSDAATVAFDPHPP